MGVASKLQKLTLGTVPDPGPSVGFRPTASTARAPGGAQRSAHTTLINTRWGLCGIAWTQYAHSMDPAFLTDQPALLSRIITPGLSALRLRAKLLNSFPAATEVFPDTSGNFCPQVVPAWFGELVGVLQGYFTNALYPAGLAQDYCHWSYWHPRLDRSRLTPFQEKVLNIVAGIPRGQVLSYAQVAQRAGNPKAARAVGAALRANPWPVLIPCHRVIGTSGALTGFTAPGGLVAKRRMLELEQIS